MLERHVLEYLAFKGTLVLLLPLRRRGHILLIRHSKTIFCLVKNVQNLGDVKYIRLEKNILWVVANLSDDIPSLCFVLLTHDLDVSELAWTRGYDSSSAIVFIYTKLDLNRN